MKKSKNEKGVDKKASLLATGFVISALVPCAAAAETQFSLGGAFNFGKPVFSSHDYTPALGGSVRFSVQPNSLFDIFVQGDFTNTSLIDGKPSASDPTKTENLVENVFSAEIGMSFYIPLNDNLKMNFDFGAGLGSLKSNIEAENNSIGTLNFFANVGVTYRFRPSVSAKATANVSAAIPVGADMIIPAGGTVGVNLNLNEAFSNKTRVGVETKSVSPVFPVLYSWYEDNPFATVEITNEEDVTIKDINVSFYQQQYMAQPNLCVHKDTLSPGESFEAELTAFFNERMLDLTELADTKSQVLVEYSYLGQRKVKTYQMNIPVYGRNSMSWADDRRAAVFVSSKDPAALWFSKYVTSIVRDNIRDGVAPNIQYAMGIFETLDQFGLNYVIDPTSAYSDNIGGESIDFLQFPYQTLMYRGGDCDDLSILVSSLFEAIGIKTAFITIPGHIFMAFDTGLNPEQAEEQFSDMTQVIVRGDKVWMPLEITISDEGFNKAWHVGAREWNTADAQDAAAIYPMEESWELYKPVNVPGATARFTMPDTTIVSKLFQHSLDEWVTKEIQPFVENYKRELAIEDNPETRNALGVLYGRYGLFTNAEEQFRKSRTEGYMPSVLNTANILFATKNYKKALQWYKLVLESEPRNEKALLGVARCEYELENYSQCDKYYAMVRAMNPAMAEQYAYLGSFFSTAGRSYTLADRLSTIQWDNPKRIKEVAVLDDGSEEEEEEPIDITAPLDLTLPKTKEEVIEEEQYVAPDVEDEYGEQEYVEQNIQDESEYDQVAEGIEAELPFIEMDASGLSSEALMLVPDADFIPAEDTVVLPVDTVKVTETAVAETEPAAVEENIEETESVSAESTDVAVAETAEENIAAEETVAVTETTSVAAVEESSVAKEAVVTTEAAVTATETASAAVETAAVITETSAEPVVAEEETVTVTEAAASFEEQPSAAPAELSVTEDSTAAIESEIVEETEEDIVLVPDEEVYMTEEDYAGQEQYTAETTAVTENAYETQEPVLEEIDYTQVAREVPRFTEQPSSEWAPDSAYTATEIPGMKSFEEEMGEYQNEKAYLYRDDTLMLGVDEDEIVEVEEEKKEEVNPFGSYIEAISDEEFMQVMAEKVSEEKLEEIKERREAEKLAREQKEAEQLKSENTLREQNIKALETVNVNERINLSVIPEVKQSDPSLTIVDVANVTTEAVVFENKSEETAEESAEENTVTENIEAPAAETKVSSAPLETKGKLTAGSKKSTGKYYPGIIASVLAALGGGFFGITRRKRRHGK